MAPPACPRRYHGPGVTGFGSAAPLHACMKVEQLSYPVPSLFAKRAAETTAAFHSRMYEEFAAFLAQYGDEIGVLLIEPQWGSSVAAMYAYPCVWLACTPVMVLLCLRWAPQCVFVADDGVPPAPTSHLRLRHSCAGRTCTPVLSAC